MSSLVIHQCNRIVHMIGLTFISVDLQSYHNVYNTNVTILLLEVVFHRSMLAFYPVRKELNDRSFSSTGSDVFLFTISHFFALLTIKQTLFRIKKSDLPIESTICRPVVFQHSMEFSCPK